MTLANLFKDSCKLCHGMVFREEHIKSQKGWKKETVCLNCKQKVLN